MKYDKGFLKLQKKYSRNPWFYIFCDKAQANIIFFKFFDLSSFLCALDYRLREGFSQMPSSIDGLEVERCSLMTYQGHIILYNTILFQNFLICIEMLFAAIALRYAFPISVYMGEGCINADGFGGGRSVTMQSISSSLKVGFLFD